MRLIIRVYVEELAEPQWYWDLIDPNGAVVEHGTAGNQAAAQAEAEEYLLTYTTDFGTM
jgi:hypothetical protein